MAGGEIERWAKSIQTTRKRGEENIQYRYIKHRPTQTLMDSDVYECIKSKRGRQKKGGMKSRNKRGETIHDIL